MPRKKVDILFADAEKELGMEQGTLALDDDDQSFVQIDVDGPMVAMDYLEDQERLVISSVLDPLDEADRTAAHEAMLRANFLWQETFGATFSLEPETGQPVLMHQLPVTDLTAHDLIELVEGMADLAVFMATHITEGADDTGADDGDMPAGPEGFIRG